MWATNPENLEVQSIPAGQCAVNLSDGIALFVSSVNRALGAIWPWLWSRPDQALHYVYHEQLAYRPLSTPALLNDQLSFSRRCSNASLMLEQRRRRWPNIKVALDDFLVFVGYSK